MHRLARIASLALAAASPAIAQQRPAPDRGPEPLRFQFLGPANGGRISAASGIPGDTLTYYFGAASGGVWKTTDGGNTAVPISDSLPVQAIGALALAPTEKNTIWIGTGEAWAIRDADVMGDGVYKSTDAGKTWVHMGLESTGRIGKIIVHPSNPDVVWVCALGRATGAQQERGVYRTIDGGRSWQRTLFVNENTGCSGIALDAKNPDVLFAGTWEVVMHTWAMFSGGPGSGVYKSTDGGATWRKLVDPGLPKSPVGKIDVAVAPSNSSRVYALIQTANQGSLWRSDDAGEKWRVVSWDRRLIGRAGYYIRVAVNPGNADEVLVANSSFLRSRDGGLTFPLNDRGCGDCHDIWMDPTNPNHWLTTGDLAVGITNNHARSFTQVQLPIGQMYHVAIDDRAPYWIYGNRQDNGTMRGPSTLPENAPGGPAGAGMRGLLAQRAHADSLRRGLFGRDSTRARADSVVPSAARNDTTRRDSTAAGSGADEGGGFGPQGFDWEHGLGGCESGFTLPTPGNPDIVWASCYGNEVTRWDAKTERARSVTPWIHTLDSPPNALKYRCHWTPPLAIDPFDPKMVYYGCQVIFRTSNEGQSWTVISPDLSTRDSSRIVSSGGIIGDNLGQFYGEVVFAIAPSEIQRGLIWAGTNDGRIWNTRDGGGNWNDVTPPVSLAPVWGTIRKIEPSHFNAGAAYVAVDYHMMDDRRPLILKTTDFGRTWTNATGDLPASHPLDYVLAVAENPNRAAMLFAGTGHAFYYSMDDGAHWTPYQGGLPAAPVSWIVTPKDWHDVVVSTYGRGVFVLRDITMLEQSDKVAATEDLHLYTPHSVYRLARGGFGGTVDVNYALRTAPAPKDSVKIEILDSTGAVIRTMKQRGRAGLNRAAWDVRYDAPKAVELRTTPPDNSAIWQESRFKGKQTRPINHWGIQSQQRQGPLVLPGNYTMRVSANGVTATQPIRVLRDPSIASADADLGASLRAQLRVLAMTNEVVDMTNRIEVMRRQVEDKLKDTAKAKPNAALAQRLRDIDAKLMDVELRFVSRTELHSDDKWYVEPYALYLNLIWLAGGLGVGGGDVAGGADFRPTDAQLAYIADLEKELAGAKAAYNTVVTRDVVAFNREAGGRITLSATPPAPRVIGGTR
ncbi:MAG TPA: hypothetical protein VKH19_08385 [Gemmatimonadaceae bacterium]|nr:hypothetical protein [Gemmatimonadaceae bacterium]